MQTTIEIPNTTSLESISIKMALEKLAKNISKDNLIFLAELSEKKDINQKISSKKTLLKTLI